MSPGRRRVHDDAVPVATVRGADRRQVTALLLREVWSGPRPEAKGPGEGGSWPVASHLSVVALSPCHGPRAREIRTYHLGSSLVKPCHTRGTTCMLGWQGHVGVSAESQRGGLGTTACRQVTPDTGRPWDRHRWALHGLVPSQPLRPWAAGRGPACPPETPPLLPSGSDWRAVACVRVARSFCRSTWQRPGATSCCVTCLWSTGEAPVQPPVPKRMPVRPRG